MITFERNEIGLTHFTGCGDFGKTLEEQLDAARVEYSQADVPHLIGMAGRARLLFYTSPKTGKHMTVLIVPVQSEIDSWGEDYYYFEEVTKEEALLDERRWLDAYDVGRGLVDAAIRAKLQKRSPDND